MQYIIYANRHDCALVRFVRNVVSGCLERCRMANLRTRVRQTFPSSTFDASSQDGHRCLRRQTSCPIQSKQLQQKNR